MTKQSLINITAKKVKHTTKKLVKETIDAFFTEVTSSLVKGDKVVISGFGTFWVSKVEDKEVVPFGDESKRQVVKGHKVVNFHVGKPLKNQVK
jgi:nucleoid DNA-binding protein